MLSDGEHNLTDTAADSSASGLLPRKGEVAAKPPEGAPAFPTQSPSSSSSSASSPPDSPCATPHSPRSAAPRRAVPTTFNPIINDEANILSAISRGDRTLFDLAEEHGTTVSNLCVWLQREDIQQKLSDLSTCGAQITRVAAVNQLPKAVKAMAFQIEAHIFDRTHNLIKPGLAADKISALRDANARKACNLLLRLARFDPSLPLYRKREPSDSSTLAPQGLAQRGEVASAQHEPVRGDPAGLPCPSPQPDILDLCAAALAAAKQAHESRIPAITEPEREGRTPEPVVSSDSRLDLAFSLASQDLANTNGNGHHHNGNGNEGGNGKHNHRSHGRVIRHKNSPDSPPRSRPPPH